MEEWEQSKPVEELCRRIAVSALQNEIDGDMGNLYEQFDNAIVPPTEIVAWLNDTPCLLLIDELNLLNLFSDGEFIKDPFLMKSNRYCVFSSHIVSATPRANC